MQKEFPYVNTFADFDLSVNTYQFLWNTQTKNIAFRSMHQKYNLYDEMQMDEFIHDYQKNWISISNLYGNISVFMEDMPENTLSILLTVYRHIYIKFNYKYQIIVEKVVIHIILCVNI